MAQALLHTRRARKWRQLCIYLLVGFSFTSVYEMIDTLSPKSFYLDPLTNLHTVPERFDFLY
jgi:hypothetical protein